MIESLSSLFPCIICGNINWKLIFHQYHKIDESNQIFHFDQNILLCRNCGLARVLFNEDYTPENLSHYYGSVSRTPVKLCVAIQNKLDPRVINAKKRVAFIEENSTGKKLLEVGFGDGFTILESQLQGYHCTGVDITSDYDDNIEFLKGMGIRIFNKNILKFEEQEKFDVVCAFLLLEHILDPISFIKKIGNLIEDDGIFVVEVPDIKKYSSFFSDTQLTFEHIYHYTIETLDLLMRLSGFEMLNYLKTGTGYGFSITAIFKKATISLLTPSILTHGPLVLKYFENYFESMDLYKIGIRNKIDYLRVTHSKVVVFGAGNYLKFILNVIGHDKIDFIDFFIDETVAKKNTTFFGKPVYSLEYLKNNKVEAIIIASEMFAEQISKRIRVIDSECKIYCFRDEVIKMLR